MEFAMSKNAVLRKAYVLSLREGALKEYVHWHKNIWPELLAKIKDEGIAEVSLFEAAPLIFLYTEIKDPDSWKRVWESDIHKRWGAEIMGPMMEYDADGLVISQELNEIWHLEN
jgi:L-rhamnose mutarotase